MKNIQFGKKSKAGTGGMSSKFKSALWALDKGVGVVICNGTQYKAIQSILAGKRIGTFFTDSNMIVDNNVEILAEKGKIHFGNNLIRQIFNFFSSN